jgi:glycosyltransferase involved in cell wall biosynthesis
VVVTAHNFADVLPRTLRSLEAALCRFRAVRPGDGDAEAVVVDDGSTDGTGREAEEFARGRAGWRVVHRDRPSSPANARNVGVREGRGALLFFLDGDDLFLPDHVAACVAAVEAGGLDFVKTGVRLADPVHPDWRPRIEFSVVINLCVRRACHDAVGGFPDYHLFRRDGDAFVPELDVFNRIEDVAYNNLLRALFRGGRVAAETVEYVRRPGNSYDRQYPKFCRPAAEGVDDWSEAERLRIRLGELIVGDRVEKVRRRLAEEGRADALLAEGREAHRAGDLRRAEGLYRRALAADPSAAQAWYLLGAVLQTLRDPAGAEAALREALARRPAFAKAHELLGVVLAARGRAADAAACFREALRLDPTLEDARRNLGLALRALGRPNDSGRPPPSRDA